VICSKSVTTNKTNILGYRDTVLGLLRLTLSISRRTLECNRLDCVFLGRDFL
jgi:hypothetical protein